MAHVAGVPVEEALVAAPALLAGATLMAAHARALLYRAARRDGRLLVRSRAPARRPGPAA